MGRLLEGFGVGIISYTVMVIFTFVLLERYSVPEMIHGSVNVADYL